MTIQKEYPSFTAKDAEFVKLSEADIAEVTAIENKCFTMPWKEEQFALAFTRNIFSVFGLKHQGRLLAYIAIYHVAGELEILNIATDPDWRRSGLGKRLLGLLLQVAEKMGITKAFLEVRPSNTPAITLYESFGFTQDGVRKNYYTDTNEDALLYSCEITPAEK